MYTSIMYVYVFNFLQMFACRNGEEKTSDETQGQNLLFAEHTVLSMLKDMEGITQSHAIFTVIAQLYKVDFMVSCMR